MYILKVSDDINIDISFEFYLKNEWILLYQDY